MADLYKELNAWMPTEYVSAAVRGIGAQHMRPPSLNALVDGTQIVRSAKAPLILSAKLGSRLLFNTDRNYVGLGDALDAPQGSVFQAAQLLCYIGNGKLFFNGAKVMDGLSQVAASGTFSFIAKSGGAYTPGPTTGPFQAGHAQPSPPIIFAKDVPSPGFTAMSAAISLVIWRVSDVDGQVSIASLPSNVLVLNNQDVIAQVPLPDSNAQTRWGFGAPRVGFADIGNYYLLPTSLGGEVLESLLAYTRVVTGASIANSTNIVNITDPDIPDQFTSADIGRRIAFGVFDSWITGINSPTQATTKDQNTSGGTIAGTATVTHAIDGVTRAVEISWSNGALLKELAPDKAYPPFAGQFAGAINDVFFVEADGIIYVSEPNQIGSFPPSNALFPNEPAIHYLRASDKLTLRFGKNSFSALIYRGGTPALEYQEIWHTQGIQYPQNVAIGARGRLMIFLGRPAIVDLGAEPNLDYAVKVLPDFAGWENQTASKSVVPCYDGVGEYECWCFGKIVIAFHVPSGRWSAPIDLTGKIIGNIVHGITFQLTGRGLVFILAASDGTNINLYEFDAGTGMTMVVCLDENVETYGDDVTELYIRGRVDNTINPVRVELIKNFSDNNNADAAPILMSNEIPTSVGHYALRSRKKQVLNCKQHSLKITMVSTTADKDAELHIAQTKGISSDVIVGRLAA